MLTRRTFVQSRRRSAPPPTSARRGRENSLWSAFEPTLEAVAPGVHLPVEQREPARPRRGRARRASRRRSVPTGARPGRYDGSSGALIEAIAKKQGVKPENIVLGCGSTQILRSCTHLFTAKDKALVGTIPTYEECAGYAEMMGHPGASGGARRRLQDRPRQVRRGGEGRGPGLLLQPEQPDRDLRRRARDARVPREAREGLARHVRARRRGVCFDYVTDPDHDTHIPIAIDNPHVIVARTFSKAYGMAGLRMGYAVGHPETIKKMAEWDAGSRHQLAQRARDAAPGIAGDPAGRVVHRRRARAEQGRARLHDEVVRRPRHEADRLAGQLHVREHRPSGEGRSATPASAKGVLVARDFPPFEKTHCRISYGTMDEMKKAVAVFGGSSRRGTASVGIRDRGSGIRDQGFGLRSRSL